MMLPFRAALYKKAREQTVVALSSAVQMVPVVPCQLEPPRLS